jgi:hypothetical protein
MRSAEEEVGMIRMDLILSYWLFLWWILYEMGIVSDNPKFMLIIGLIVNGMMLMRKIVVGSQTIVPFVIVNMVIKVIPLMMLMSTTIMRTDVEASVIVVLLYIVWVLLNIETVVRNLKNGAKPPFEYWWVKNKKNGGVRSGTRSSKN